MNGTPHVLNRILIGILGLKLLAIGILLVLLATVPAVGTWWQGWSAGLWEHAKYLSEQTRIPGREESWLWVAAAAVLVVLIVLMVAWVSQQGKGRANLIVSEYDEAGTPGDVNIGGNLAEQALKHALADRTDLAGVTVATYEVNGRPGLRIRVQPRQGVSPHTLAADVSRLVEALDMVVGRKTPVLIHIGAGARTRFSRAERVR
ncbi:hypothetical protein [Arthrobacter bambusae]|uniref:hypothetical protein n=1 Tax=Arthrobacter bambusae TaxID=1338426 RepID=UPI002785D602|nr:hypothetical protein [Arthrobacter bambusae]MDQ0030622.1 hypothetical protein [Arthrobacter bambusae]MDQ0099091.1 hypothetical protein [Arthrobacter bambusae]